MIVVNLGFDLGNTLIVATLSIVLIIEFRKIMRSSILGTNNNQVLRRRKAENEFTKTTLIFALIHLIMRFFHLLSIFLEFTYYGGIIQTPIYFGYCITLTHLFVMFSVALNLPILYKFNSKFRKSAKELLVQKSNS